MKLKINSYQPFARYIIGFDVISSVSTLLKLNLWLLEQLLGIIVDDTLTWEEHIEYVSVKIKRGIGILKVTGKFLKRESLILIYRTLIEPYLRYCSTVWGQCNETQKDKLQALQNKAARTIAKVKFHDVDHTRLLHDLGWLNVRSLLELDMGIFMYKCQNKLMPDSIANLFRTVDSVHSYQTRAAKSGNLNIPESLHSSAQKSISNKGAKVWNESLVRFEIPEQSIASKKNWVSITWKCNATINIPYISTHTDAFSVIMIQLIFLLLFTVSPYFSIYLADLPVVTMSDRTYSELNSVYVLT